MLKRFLQSVDALYDSDVKVNGVRRSGFHNNNITFVAYTYVYKTKPT